MDKFDSELPLDLQRGVQDMIRFCGDDPTRPGMIETPARYLKAMRFWTQGYRQDPKKILKIFEDGAERYNQMIFQRDIPVWSLCEHHLAPFFGVAHIAYIPSADKPAVVGLSKLARLVDVFARRFQVQERLTQQVANALHDNLHPRGVGVVLECRHTCIESRGVCKAGTVTVTSALMGAMENEPSARSEFLRLIGQKT